MILRYSPGIKKTPKNKNTKTLIQTIRIYTNDIEIEFGIEKMSYLLIKRGK